MSISTKLTKRCYAENAPWIELTTKIGCKNNCSYCPQEKIIKSYIKRSNVLEITLENFIDCLNNIPKNYHVGFGAFSEPWLNKECTDMILYADEKNHKITICTSCINLKLEDIEKIKNIEFLNFIVHIPEDGNETKIKVDDYYNKILKKLIDSDISNLKFILKSVDNYSIHKKIDKRIFKDIIVLNGELQTRAGNIDIEGIEKSRKKKGSIYKCPRLFCNVLLPNGDLALCCMDWGLKHIIGNLHNTNLKDIYKGKIFKEVLNNLNKYDSDVLCRECEWSEVVK
jgi:hypothetical protein